MNSDIREVALPSKTNPASEPAVPLTSTWISRYDVYGSINPSD